MKKGGKAPHFMADSLLDISPGWFIDAGVTFVFIDLDNTMSPYGASEPTAELRAWTRELKNAGLTPFILSNNRGSRPGVFASVLDIGFVGSAAKPFTRVLRKTLSENGVSPKDAALVGDQVFTDMWCAKRSGVLSITVRPLCLKNPVLALRYGIELPFRAYFRVTGSKIERTDLEI